MNKLKVLFLFAFTMYLTTDLQAQRRVLSPNRAGKPVKDTLALGCILAGQVYAPDDNELNALGEKELKAVVSSSTDTTVKAPWSLTISAVTRLEDGSFELVASH